MVRILKESKEDKQRFIDKFGEEIYNKVKSLEQTPYAQEVGLNDLTFCVKKYSKEWMEQLISRCEKETYEPKFNKRFGGALTYRFDGMLDWVSEDEIDENDSKEMLEFKYWLKKPKRELINFIKKYGYDDEEMMDIKRGAALLDEIGRWKLYEITNYNASEYYGLGSGWCICGAYPGKYANGEHYFYQYSKYDTYYFIISEEADERYCVFVDDYKKLQVWDGSHGKDIEVTRPEIISLDENVQELIQEISDRTGVTFTRGVPDDKDEQYDIIRDYLSEGLVEVLGGDVFYSYCESHDLMQLIVDREAEGFYYDYDPEYRFELLKEYTDVMDAYDSFQDVPDEEKKKLGNYYEEYGEGFKNSYDNFKDYFIDTYGDWVSLSYGEASDILERFDITPEDIAEHIVYDLDDGYRWCEMILANDEE